ncbi:MAG: hypothetical protein OEY29_08710 [Gammaproteobacteria bacterium]|nr:hypothetical protein [Gammaproteobacteria bacterium]
MNNQLQAIINTVQKNCHISDAHHAGDYTLCIYLLKMREFYRWEKHLGFNDELSSDEIGGWLTEREALWDELGDSDFSVIEPSQTPYNAFDSDAINQQLIPQGYIYSAGYGAKSKAIFYIAELEQQILQDGFTVYISGKELARDLTAPVAMSQQNNIYIRRESLQRMVWEKTVEWGWHRNKNAMFRAMNFYDFSAQADEAINKMTANEINNVILHEIGEIKSAQELGNWQQMITELPPSQAEIMARAIKDLLADAISTLPVLINNRDEASIHFYFANFTHMRKELSAGLLQAYQQWDNDRDYAKLLSAVNQSREHWFDIARDILDIYEHHGTECATPIEALVKENKLGACH